MSDLRIATAELLPLDDDRREEALVHLAFLAQAAVAPELSDASEGAAQRLQEPLAARIAHLVRTGDLPARLDAEGAAARLRVLLDGLGSSPSRRPGRPRPSGRYSVLDDYLAALATPPAEAARPTESTPRKGDPGRARTPMWA